MLILKLIKESFFFAISSLIANKLRTFLSLLGITIGIFAIISVFSVIDSLERSIHDSITSLGDDIIYVQKWPWAFSSDYPWWKYLNRPLPTLKESKEIEKRSEKAGAICFSVATQKAAIYKNNSIDNTTLWSVSQSFEDIRSFDIEDGRYFSDIESAAGKNIAVIGHKIAEELYRGVSPVGKQIKVMGRKLYVIGVFKKEGESAFSNSMDNVILIPINYARNILDIRNERLGPLIMVKAKEGVPTVELIDEMNGIMRSIRKLKPKVEDNFALNQASFLSKGIEQIFKSISMGGWIIGLFSIIVGGFGIANIMFVSVKERTAIIGIQKALGAKKYFILLQFLVEAVILSLFGGLLGLLITYFGTVIANSSIDFEILLSLNNVIWGISLSVVIGLISGIFPAYSASKLNPVEAINTGM